MDRRPMLIAGAAIIVVLIVGAVWLMGGFGSGAPEPTATPTQAPTAEPTDSPSPSPTDEPTPEPTPSRTPEPTQSGGSIQVPAWAAVEGIDGWATISNVRYVDGRFIAVGAVVEGPNLAAAVWTSGDGASWRLAEIEPTRQADEYTHALDVAAAEDGTLVAVGSWGVVPSDQFSRMVWRSTDGGATWTASRENQAAFQAVIPGGPGLVAIESSGGGVGPARGYIATSADGISWERQPMTFEANLQTIAAIGDRLVVAGGVETGVPGEYDAAAWYSDDAGASWTRVELLDGGVPEQIVAMATAGDVLVATGDEGTAWRTADGASWEVGGIEADASAHGLTAVDGGFVATGNLVGQDIGAGRSWVSTDGLSWEPAAPFDTVTVRLRGAASDGTTVVAGGECLASDPCDAVLWVGRVTTGE